uniref:Calponin-homology (CH) domain-containing protein n=1 Tax=Strigamia maritima TaxID=126957 RepID=T1JJX6_STRMM
MAAVDEGITLSLEPRPFRPFKTSEEYLWAMKEDLADWLHSLYNLDITAENFFEKLETGVTVCQHANRVRQLALAQRSSAPVGDEVVHRCDVAAGTFHARDNVSNFIAWCRGLGVMECLLFETEDLVMRKNERSFILCLLEIARRGAKFGMPAPTLVRMEEEIEREILKDIEKKRQQEAMDYDGDESEEEEEEQDLSPPLQIITNDLKSLDEMVSWILFITGPRGPTLIG